VFWLSFPTRELIVEEGPPKPPKGSVRVFDLEKRKEAELIPNVERYALSFDGSKVLYKSDKIWRIVESKEGPKPVAGAPKEAEKGQGRVEAGRDAKGGTKGGRGHSKAGRAKKGARPTG